MKEVKAKKSMTKSTKQVLFVVITSVICALIMVGVYLTFFTNVRQQESPKNDSSSVEHQNSDNEYTKPDFITAEMNEDWIKVFRETNDSQAFEDRVMQDFADNEVSFDWLNPYHVMYLNIPEEFPNE